MLWVQSSSGFNVLFESGGTLVLHKPAGMATSMRVDKRGESLIAQVRKEYPEAELPHRLDRITGGAVVVATDPATLRFHNAAIQERLWRKVYVARCLWDGKTCPSGIVGEHRAYLRAPKGGGQKGRRATVVRSGGKPSRLTVLHAEVGIAPFTMDIVVDLHTGRYHQIRAMMAHLGFPLLGDDMYGGGLGPLHEIYKLNGLKVPHAYSTKAPDQPVVLTHVLCKIPLPPTPTSEQRANSLALRRDKKGNAESVSIGQSITDAYDPREQAETNDDSLHSTCTVIRTDLIDLPLLKRVPSFPPGVSDCLDMLTQKISRDSEGSVIHPLV